MYVLHNIILLVPVEENENMVGTKNYMLKCKHFYANKIYKFILSK